VRAAQARRNLLGFEFDEAGESLDDPGVRLASYAVRVDGDRVRVAASPSGRGEIDTA
jgi:hypothetical protein